MVNSSYFIKVKNRTKQLRPFIVIGWVSVVCLCYGYYYVQHLLHAYPVLQQVRELGIIELVKRYFAP